MPLTPQNLPDVDEAKEAIRQRQEAQQAKLDERQQDKQEQLQARIDEAVREREKELIGLHEVRRTSLRNDEQELVIRHQHERLSLHAAQKSESGGMLFRARTAVADLIAKTPGLRSVLKPIQKMSGIDPRLRHVMEREALARRHERERAAIEGRKRALSRQETREKASLRWQASRDLTPELARAWSRQQAQHLKSHAKQEFFEAARNQKLWQRRKFERGDMQVAFNDAAEFVEGAGREDEDGSERGPRRKAQSDGVATNRRLRTRKGRGFRRGNDE